MKKLILRRIKLSELDDLPKHYTKLDGELQDE
jgi:hypothetical protein